MSPVLFAFLLTLGAGLATCIGSALAFFAKRTNTRFLSIATGFSAGVMIYVSFVEIFPKGSEALIRAFGSPRGDWINVLSFFGGILLIGIIDKLIPTSDNPHEVHAEQETACLKSRPLFNGNQMKAPAPAMAQKKLLRMGVLTALAIGIHNFPEGLVTFLSALEDPAIGVAIAVAVALHNIPEGISVAVPIFYATGSRRKAFVWSCLSGLAEPVGALIAWLALRIFWSVNGGAPPPALTGILFGGVAGIMVFISLDELLPTSRVYGKGHDSLFGLLAGMAMMALSLLLMK